MGPIEYTKKNSTLREIITYCAKQATWLIFYILFGLAFMKWGLDTAVFPRSQARPLLSATVSCESWTIPTYLGEGIKLWDTIVTPSDTKRVLGAESMYIIEVTNKSDNTAAMDVNAVIEGNLYAEVTRNIGKDKKSPPKEHFKKDEIQLGPIFPDKTLEIKAWITDKPSRRFAQRNIKIGGANAVSSLYVEKPVRKIIRRLDKFLRGVTVLTILAILLFHGVMFRIKRKIKG